MFQTKNLAVLALLSSLSLGASAKVITFNGLAGTAVPGNSSVQNVYGLGDQTYFRDGHPARIDGYDFSDQSALMITPQDTQFGGATGPFAWNGTDYLVGLNVTIAAADANPFSVQQLDLVSWASPNTYVNLVGFKNDGSYVTARITNTSTNQDVANDFVTYTLANFSDLTRLDLLTSQDWFALDNLVVT